MTESTVPNSQLENCEKEENNAFEALNQQQAEYDKQLLALSAAFLGVALAFIKNVVPLQNTTDLWIFDSAVGLLFGCVCFVLCTFQYSIHGNFHIVEYWKNQEKHFKTPDKDKGKIDTAQKKLRDKISKEADRIKVANRMSGVLFFLGILALIFFVAINLHRAAASH